MAKASEVVAMAIAAVLNERDVDIRGPFSGQIEIASVVRQTFRRLF